MKLTEKQFIAGFNQGYLFAQFEPILLSIILRSLKQYNSHTFGLSIG